MLRVTGYAKLRLLAEIQDSSAKCLKERFLLGDKPHLYGRQRLFGSLGFGIMTLMGGWLTDWFSDDTFDKNYKPLFLTAAAILSANLLFTFKIKVFDRSFRALIFVTVCTAFHIIIFA